MKNWLTTTFFPPKEKKAGFFAPPFLDVPSVVWIFFVFCYFMYPDSQILRGNFPDTDDYTYLNQTIDWLKGQNWFDNVQYRYAPPTGTLLHFTRIGQLPLAAIISLFHKAGFSWVGAGTLAVGVWSSVMFGLFLWAIRWTCDAFVSKEWSRLSSFVTVTSMVAASWFMIGHIDHHSAVMCLIVVAVGAVARLFSDPAHPAKWGFISAFCLALSLAIALEALPWVALISAYLCFWAMLKGRATSPALAVYGVTLHLFSLVYLLILRRPAEWMSFDLMFYSAVYVVLTGGAAVCCLGIALAAQTRSSVFRYITGIGLALGMGGLFFVSFPEMLKGPYGAMDPELRKLFFENIAEAVPFFTDEVGFFVIVVRLFPGVFATLVALTQVKKLNELSHAWALVAIMTFSSLVLASLYQIRFINCTAVFAIIPMTFVLWRGWLWLEKNSSGRKRFWQEILLVLLVGPMFSVLLPALKDGRSFNPGILMFPVSQSPDKCDMRVLEQVLMMPKFYGEKPLNIMNMVNTGPELVFRTKHTVMAAPYHMNVKGNMDAYHFFSTKDPNVSYKIAKENKIDLIVMCRGVSGMYLGDKGPNQIKVSEDGKVEMRKDASFAEHLIYHKNPKWLREAKYPFLTNYYIYEVKERMPEKRPFKRPKIDKAKAEGRDLRSTEESQVSPSTPRSD